LHVPGRAPIRRPDLQGCFDLIGFSYYATIGVRAGRLVPYPADAAPSPLGYHIWADGLRPVLDRLHAEIPDTPILVAEFGVGTRDDQVRGAYITCCLQITNDAIARGVDVRGMFHWTSVDNYEWHHGYDVPFGLIDRDRNIRASAQILSREARAAQ
jgi:beta-glucosidase